MAKNWLINARTGENNYLFNWMDENGEYCGFNDEWGSTIGEARKRAKKRETKAHWVLWDDRLRKYITIPNEVTGKGHCYRNKGMYINPKSFKRATMSKALEMDRIGNMLSC